MAKLNEDVLPYGDPKSKRFETYGPNDQQMLDNPTWKRTAAQNQRRLADRYYGPGGYWSDLGRSIGHWGTRIAGGALGAASGLEGGFPGVIGGAIGGWEAGADISRAAGWGAYNVPRGANDLFGPVNGNGSAPVYHSAMAHDDMGDVIISNRELVTLVKSSPVTGQFHIQTFTLNPVDSTFHHLAQQAKQYEQFEYLGLIFQYVPMTGEGGTNELGVIGMASSYDPDQVRTFATMEDLMRFKGATTSKPSIGMLHGIECDPSKRAIKTMYVRDSINRSKDFTEPATFYFASEGVKGTSVTLGQLWVTYSIKLRNIKPSEEVSSTLGKYHLAAATHDTPDVSLAETLDYNFYPILLNIESGQAIPTLNPSTAVSSVYFNGIVTNNDEEVVVKLDKNKVVNGEHYIISLNLWLHMDSGTLQNADVSSSCAIGGTGVERVAYSPQIPNESICGQLVRHINTNYEGTKTRVEAVIRGIVKVTDDTVDPMIKIRTRFTGSFSAAARTGVKAGVRVSCIKVESSTLIR